MAKNSMNKFKKASNILVIIVLVGVAWILLKQLYINPMRLKTGIVKYTIGIIIAKDIVADGGPIATYAFQVKGKKYKKEYGIEDYQTTQIGNRYFVKFLESDPSNCELLFDQPVKDEIKDAPASGWDGIPIAPELSTGIHR